MTCNELECIFMIMITKTLFILALIVTLFFGHNIVVVHANISSELEVTGMIEKYDQRLKVIQQLQSQDIEIHSQLSMMNQKIYEGDQLMRDLQHQIDEVMSKIQSTQKSIFDIQNNIESRNSLLKNRLRIMYANGNVSYLDVILSSTDFSDFISRITILTMVIKKDEGLLEAMTKEKTAFNYYQEELEIQNSLLVAQKNTLQTIKSEHEKMIKEHLMLLNQLQQTKNNEIGAALKESDELKAIDIELTPTLEERLNAALEKNITSYGVWGWPVPTSHLITSNFGIRENEFHAGIDIGAPIGTPIVAVDNGVVLFSGKASGFGHWVVIHHSNGLMSIYGHMFGDGIYVSVGQEVERGQVIAAVGNDGESTGPHLHFGVATGTTGNQLNYIDPRPYLDNLR